MSYPLRNVGRKQAMRCLQARCIANLCNAALTCVLLVLALFVQEIWSGELVKCAPVEAGEELSGGDTTVFDTSPKAFGFPAANLKDEHRASFFVGHSFFNENWVVAPASTAGRG